MNSNLLTILLVTISISSTVQMQQLADRLLIIIRLLFALGPIKGVKVNFDNSNAFCCCAIIY
jgi:hypothetical protein